MLLRPEPGISEERLSTRRGHARIIAVTSGKGGVGKTNVCANLGIALASLGRRVCVLDADMGLANVNILIGRQPEFTLEHVVKGEKSLAEVIIEGPGGIHVVPASSGTADQAQLTSRQIQALHDGIRQLGKDFEYLIVDTSAGISGNVVSMAMAAPETILIVTPEPTSLTDSYSLLKILKKNGYKGKSYLLTNLVRGRDDGVEIYKRFSSVVSTYLGGSIDYLGYVLRDRLLVASVMEQTPIVLYRPQAEASRCFSTIAGILESDYPPYPSGDNGGAGDGWPQPGLPAAKPGSDVYVEVTPPPAVKAGMSVEGFSASVAPDEYLVDRIEATFSSEAEARALITRLEEAYALRFGKPASEPKAALRAALEEGGFSETAMRELGWMLESLHEKRFHRPLWDPKDILLRILEDASASEDRLTELWTCLEQRFHKLMGEKSPGIRIAIGRLLADDSAAEPDFLQAVEMIKETHLKRFGKPLHDSEAVLHGELEETLFAMKEMELLMETLMTSLSDTKRERLRLENLLMKKRPDKPQ